MSAADQNLAEMAQRLEAALRRPAGDAPPVAPEPPTARPVSRNEPPAPPAAAPSPKTGFENLEDEMASLLGRPKSPS
jgi:flagellar protein FliO/FliZ